ncbi:MAG: hypothetical protein WAV76_09820 [Bacteroidota bacterium]
MLKIWMPGLLLLSCKKGSTAKIQNNDAILKFMNYKFDQSIKDNHVKKQTWSYYSIEMKFGEQVVTPYKKGSSPTRLGEDPLINIGDRKTDRESTVLSCCEENKAADG